MPENMDDKKLDIRKGLVISLALVSTFMASIIGTIMLRFSRRPDIVPTGPMGTMEDPQSYRMGLLLIFCAVLFFIGIIFSKRKFSPFLIIGGGLISLVPLAWGWLNATSIYLGKAVVLMGFASSVSALVLAVLYLFRGKN